MTRIQSLFALAVVLLSAACGTMVAHAQTTPPVAKAATPMNDTRFVIFHTPGPQWVPSKSLFEQDGVQAHVAHYRKLHAEGKLTLGGPFLDAQGGGMMIAEPGMSEQELAAFAQADPAVQSGLLKASVRPWLIGMKK